MEALAKVGSWRYCWNVNTMIKTITWFQSTIELLKKSLTFFAKLNVLIKFLDWAGYNLQISQKNLSIVFVRIRTQQTKRNFPWFAKLKILIKFFVLVFQSSFRTIINIDIMGIPSSVGSCCKNQISVLINFKKKFQQKQIPIESKYDCSHIAGIVFPSHFKSTLFKPFLSCRNLLNYTTDFFLFHVKNKGQQLEPWQPHAEIKFESKFKPLPVIWQLLPKAIPEENCRFWLQNQWPSSCSSVSAQAPTQGFFESAAVSAGTAWQQQACFRKKCYHSCATDLLLKSKRF